MSARILTREGKKTYVMKGGSLGALRNGGKGNRALRCKHWRLVLGVQIEFDQLLDAGLANQLFQDALVVLGNSLDSSLLSRSWKRSRSRRRRWLTVAIVRCEVAAGWETG